jgi:hypothetical protein
MDRREEILKQEHQRGPNHITPEGYSQWVLNAMDVHATELCLKFIEFVAHETTGHSYNKTKDELEFKYKGEWISKEKLFENFL